jgi:hypothetical protein
MNIQFEQLRTLEEKVKPHLKNNEYTFIGPVDQNLFAPFMKNAHRIALNNCRLGLLGPTLHELLSNKDVISSTIETVNPDAPLRIYIVNIININRINDKVLLHDTIENYCDKNNINLEDLRK